MYPNNSTQFKVFDLQQARNHSKMFCHRTLKDHLSNSSLVIHTNLQSHFSNGSMSSLVSELPLYGKNQSITVGIGSDPETMVYEHIVGIFSNGSTVDDKVRDCEAEFDKLLDNVRISSHTCQTNG